MLLAERDQVCHPRLRTGEGGEARSEASPRRPPHCERMAISRRVQGRAMLPSSLTTSHSTPAGCSPASRQRSPAA